MPKWAAPFRLIPALISCCPENADFQVHFIHRLIDFAKPDG
jgi:hypothetical protein